MMVLQRSRWGLGSSLVSSLVGHGLVLSGVLAGWEWASRRAVFPADAVEVSLGEISLSAGAHKAVASRNEPVLPEGDGERLKSKPQPNSAAQAVGQGGDTAQSQGAIASEWDQYRMRLRERIHEALVYPRVSKNLGESGRVTVAVSVLRDGAISEVRIAEPSAYDRLNLAAIDTVRRVARLDPLPKSYGADKYNALVPIDFSLH